MKNFENLKNQSQCAFSFGGGALSLASRALRACDVVKLFSQEAERIFEGNTLSRIAKIRSRSLSNSALSQGERKFVNPLSWERGRGEGNSSFAQQTDEYLFTYLPIHLFTSKKLDCFARPADGGNWARNDVKTLVPQYLSALVSSKRVAFTLAEVLITLGIIGVVAALTMPNLMAKYQNLVLSTQLKKVVNNIDNGSKAYLAKEGLDDLTNSSFIIKYSGVGYELDTDFFVSYFKFEPLHNSKFEKDLKKYSFLIKENRGNFYRSPDGSFWYIPNVWTAGSDSQYEFVDINGDRGPNSFGYDRFHPFLVGSIATFGPTCDTLLSCNTKKLLKFYKLKCEDLSTMLDTIFSYDGDDKKLMIEEEFMNSGLIFPYCNGWNIEW